MKLSLNADSLTRETAARFEEAAKKIGGVRQVDTWAGRAEIEIADPGVKPHLMNVLTSAGFEVAEIVTSSGDSNIIKVCIDGMTCRSCEMIVERKFKRVAGVRKVDADAAAGVARVICEDGCRVDVNQLQAALSGDKYAIRGLAAARDRQTLPPSGEQRPSFLRLIGLFALVIILGSLFEKLGIFGPQTDIAGSMTFAAALVLGLVAGSSSCLAVSGGLLLSSAGKFNERYGSASKRKRMRPVFLFVAGRVLAYGFFGGLIGLLGTTFTFSPLVTGGLIVLAAFYMLIMGLEMLHISPRWLKACLPRMPKALSHRIIDAEGREHWDAPFLLGAATFFLPCGFTQALQVYALTTGSLVESAVILAAFAIGTAPALLALGWASSSIKGKAGRFFFQFSGALVVVLGLWNMQNGFTLAGYPLSFPTFEIERTASAADTAQTGEGDANVIVEDGVQVIRMSLSRSAPYYEPAGSFTVQAGVPVRMEILGKGSGCRSALQIPRLGVGTYLNKDINVLEFTPESSGRYTFSCSMGMFPGTLNVVSS